MIEALYAARFVSLSGQRCSQELMDFTRETSEPDDDAEVPWSPIKNVSFKDQLASPLKKDLAPIDQSEVHSWRDMISSTRHRQGCGILLFGYSVGRYMMTVRAPLTTDRFQLISVVGAWVVGIWSERGVYLFQMFPFLAFLGRLWVFS